MRLRDKARDTAKTLLSGMPSAYRLASITYRSSAVARGMAYLAKRATPLMMGARPIVIVYSSEPRPRWVPGVAAHPGLSDLLNGRRRDFEERVGQIATFRPFLERIAEAVNYGDPEPSWINGFFGGLDAASLYAFVASGRPKRYFEVGSGNSTKFARRAIRDHALATTITSIDPAPRWDIDTLCDRVIRQPLEDVDVTLFDELEAGDVLFFDGSHHAFMNSDVVAFWLDILPRLKPGVLVHIHDIFLPYDYPNDWVERHYTEQYLLAVALLAPGSAFDVVFASQFAVRDPELSGRVRNAIGFRADGEASSFWLRTRTR